MARDHVVILDLTERCNLKCVMCYFANTDRLRFQPYDRELDTRGLMPVDVFEKIAADLFPGAWRVALGCAAEPLIHPKFKEIVTIAGRYNVPDLWFPTNLLALTEKSAEAILDAGVTTVAASIDGITRETYESIRIGGKFERLEQRLDLLNEMKRQRGVTHPRLRIIFTWMKSNRGDLRGLPEFAARHGASELDVRFVTPTTGVDVTPQLLSNEDPAQLRAELRAAAEEAVARGIRLASYPEFETAEDRPRGFLGRLQRKTWRWRAGLERWEYLRHAWYERRAGCSQPDRTWVIRPNGAVFPCTFWEQEPLGFYPEGDRASFQNGEVLEGIREGLLCGKPVGSCAGCTQRRDAFYRPMRRLRRAEMMPAAEETPSG